MVVRRHLGVTWAAVHGPAAPRDLAVWILDLGFSGLVVGPAPRPVDWSGLRALRSDLPFAFAAVRVAGPREVDDRADAGLASRHEGERAAALASVGQAVETARRLGVDRIVLEPGRARVPGDAGELDLGDRAIPWTADRARAGLARRNAVLDTALDCACRSLHQLCKSFPDFTFCLEPSLSVVGLGEPEALSLIFEDLPGSGLAYWHDAPITARRHEVLGEEQGVWVERFAPRIGGMTLGDTLDGELYLPPGAGLVDYPLLASYMGKLTRETPAVVELDPAVPPAEIPGMHSFLTKFGL